MNNIFTQIITHGQDGKWEPTEECQPTMFWPGSEEKVKLMAGRVFRGEPVFHEKDEPGVSYA